MFRDYLKFSTFSKFAVAFMLIIFTAAYSEAKTYTANPGKMKVLTAISQYDADSCGIMTPPKYKIT